MSLCLVRSNIEDLQELHFGVVGGHFSVDVTTRKILDASYWWATLHINTLEFFHTYDQCQRVRSLVTHNMVKLVISLPA
jgi:hypothetical protein